MIRLHVRRFIGGRLRIAAVAIAAAKVKGQRRFRVEMRIVGILVTANAAGAFGVGAFLGLAEQVFRSEMLSVLSRNQEKMAVHQAPKEKAQGQDDECQAGSRRQSASWFAPP